MANDIDLIAESTVQQIKGFPKKSIVFLPGNLLLPPLAGTIANTDLWLIINFL